MELSLKTKIIGSGILLLAVFAGGRYSAPERIKIEKEEIIVKVTDTSTKTDVKKDQVVKTNTKVTTLKDGTKIEETNVVQETKENSNTVREELVKESVKTTETKVVDSGARVKIDALFGLMPQHMTDGFIYGAHVSKQLFGPFSLGVWTTVPRLTIGVSVGMKL